MMITLQFGGIYVAAGGWLTLASSKVFGDEAETSSGRQHGEG
jgi:hypothetical protein